MLYLHRLAFFLAVVVAFGLLSGCASGPVNANGGYQNPLVERRADPWVVKHMDGYYYFIATVPEYDRLEIRRAKTINALTATAPTTVWRKTAELGANIWAPELHWVDNTWVIYFAAAPAEKPFLIRMHVLSNRNANPLAGDWQYEGQIKTPTDSFALDATTFEHNGKRYLMWAQMDQPFTYNSALLIAEMDGLAAIKEPVITISEPTLPWEVIGYKVNEGPAVIKRNNKIFVTYSASATDHNYAMGLLWADQNANLLDVNSWMKSPKPVFYSSEIHTRFGPGHSCFTVSEDGKTDLLVYHARSYKQIEGNPLLDGNRHTRVRSLSWGSDGMPIFSPETGD